MFAFVEVRKYSFISNNCADGARELIQKILPVNHDFQWSSANTPQAVWDEIIRFDLANIVPQLTEEFVKMNLYVPSRQILYDNSIRNIGLSRRGSDFIISNGQKSELTESMDSEDYFEKTSSQKRRELFSNESITSRQAASFYILESEIKRRKINKIYETVFKTTNGKQIIANSGFEKIYSPFTMSEIMSVLTEFLLKRR